jgi:hypothetical protein
MISTRTKIVASVIFVLVVVGLLLAVHVVTEHSDPAPQPTNSVTSTSPVAVAQPPSGKDVAEAVHCTDFKDMGGGMAGLVLDSGTCMKDGKKYGLNTFPSKEGRDDWIKAASQVGVVPKWETDTSVVYPSVSN